MTTIEALKELIVTICGVEESAITGETIPEIIKYLSDNYPTTENAE